MDAHVCWGESIRDVGSLRALTRALALLPQLVVLERCVRSERACVVHVIERGTDRLLARFAVPADATAVALRPDGQLVVRCADRLMLFR